jgi:hypothetical protein
MPRPPAPIHIARRNEPATIAKRKTLRAAFLRARRLHKIDGGMTKGGATPTDHAVMRYAVENVVRRRFASRQMLR